MESLEANSAAAFGRKIALKVDPHNAPKMSLAGWNVGKRKSSVTEKGVHQPIGDILSVMTLQTLGYGYFDKVNPCYGFINAAQFFYRLDTH